MKHITIIAAMAGAILLLSSSSCGKEEPTTSKASISATPLDVNVDYTAQTVEVSVTSSGEWGVSIDGAPDWVSVSPSGGLSGTEKVVLTFSENKGLEARTAKILFKSGSARANGTITQGFDENSEIVVPEGYKLVWQEEFDEGSIPSTDKWWYETGAGGWGNNEIQEYVAQKTPGGTSVASIEKGILTIKTLKENNKVYSIRMNTKEGWTYGWFEARIQVSDVPGSWPAFWMMPQNFTAWPKDGEIDIMEYAISTQGQNKSSSSIHCAAFNWPNGTQKTHVQSVPNAATEFHVYALEWTADQMVFYIDGKKHLTFANDGKGYDHWPFNQPFYLKLNQAWGGNMGGTTNDSGLPALYKVDYVRVFQKK